MSEVNEVKRISSQLRRSFDGEAWHGPSVREVLANVTAGQAAARPIPNAHTIWELALHIAAWENVARRRIEGEIIPNVSNEEDWPAVTDTGEEAWQKAIEYLGQNHEALRDVVRKLDEAQLSEMAAGANYSVYFLLHGVVQHNIYHAGQIALLKKANGQ